MAGKMKDRFSNRWCLVALLACCLSTMWAGTANAVKIAAIFSQTGIAAEGNTQAIEAVQMAVEKINTAGGIFGAPLELLLLDNQSTPLGSLAAARNAVAARVAGVIGPARSSQAIAVANVLQKAKIPMITPDATDPQITRIGDYIFRACLSDEFQGQRLAQFARRDLKAKTAVILVNNTEAYSIGLATVFKTAFIQDGGRLLWEGDYKGNAIDFTAPLTTVRQFHPDLLFIPGYSRDAGLIAKQAARMGITIRFLGGDGWDGGDIIDYGGKALEGSFYMTHWHPNVSFPSSGPFIRAFQNRIGAKTAIMASGPLAYDAVNLLADAIVRAGSSEPDRIREALSATRRFEGVSGHIRFDANGDPLEKPACIIQIRKSQLHLYRTISP
jgi:branched-chain amino acid transport system substrate-binding protein